MVLLCGNVLSFLVVRDAVVVDKVELCHYPQLAKGLAELIAEAGVQHADAHPRAVNAQVMDLWHPDHGVLLVGGPIVKPVLRALGHPGRLLGARRIWSRSPLAHQVHLPDKGKLAHARQLPLVQRCTHRV